MGKSLLLFAFLLIIQAGAAPQAQADEVYTFVVKKQEAKAKSRWSLTEWLETRDRMRLMDLWLAMHSPSPYEFFVSGAYQAGSLSTETKYGATEFSAAAYASIFGLAFEREGGLETRYNGLFHLRVVGYHYQGTHLRLEAGLRRESNGSGLSFQNALAGVGMTVYLAKYFGVEGLYRHAFDSTPNASGLTFSGNRYEGGAFIDFNFLRVFGKYVIENASGSDRSGPQAGLKLFF